jgi:hypothetical protein
MSNDQIHFTAEEISKIIIYKGDLPKARLLPRNHATIEGKEPYTKMLCQKLGEIVQGRGVFSLAKSFCYHGEHARCYTKCQHGVKMPVQFKCADLAENQPLVMKFKLKCNECGKSASNSSASAESAAADPPVTSVVSAPSVPAAEVSVPAPATPAISTISAELATGYNVLTTF